VPESASEPYDANGIHMPGQSWYPFIMGAAFLPFSYGLLYHNFWVLGLSILIFFVGTFAWAFEGVGGHHLPAGGSARPKGARS
jgi:cytochrome c oxidase subunit 1